MTGLRMQIDPDGIPTLRYIGIGVHLSSLER